MTPLWLFSLAAAALLGAYTVQRVLREQLALEPLSGPTVVCAWTMYLWFTALVVLSAWSGIVPLGLGVGVRWGLGSGLLALGVALAAAGMLWMGSLRRMSGREPATLITDGVYRISRNPQNVGWLLALAGASVAGDSGFALTATAVGAALFLAYLPAEEHFLSELHGPAYRQYLLSAPRFLGWPRRSGGAYRR